MPCGDRDLRAENRCGGGRLSRNQNPLLLGRQILSKVLRDPFIREQQETGCLWSEFSETGRRRKFFAQVRNSFIVVRCECCDIYEAGYLGIVASFGDNNSPVGVTDK